MPPKKKTKLRTIVKREVVPSMDSITTATRSPVAQQQTDFAAGTYIAERFGSLYIAPVTFLIMRWQPT